MKNNLDCDIKFRCDIKTGEVIAKTSIRKTNIGCNN